MNVVARLFCVVGMVAVGGAIVLAATLWLPAYVAGMIAGLVLIVVWHLAGRLEKEF